MTLTDGQGRNLPIFVDYHEYKTITTADFSPSEDPSLTETQINRYMDKGFIARPDADGAFYGITLHAYLENKKSLTGLIPERFNGLADTWIECRYVKIFASNDASYATVANHVTIGITI